MISELKQTIVTKLGMAKIALTGRDVREMEELCRGLGFEPYKGRQISLWIYRKRALSFEVMSDLPSFLREKLKEVAIISPLDVLDAKTSSDGATKYLLSLSDGNAIESVYIPHREWETICVSTQVGCPIGCRFCASGGDFVRNLTCGEIVAQVLLLRKSERTNVVFMGVGEPFLNRKEVFGAIKLLNREVGIGARRMFVSTVGIVEGIEELSDSGMEVNLAISLHATEDELRKKLIPACLPSIEEIMEACGRYYEKTKRRISFEYVLFRGLNDSPQHAEKLAAMLRGLNCHVNLIPYNETEKGFARPSPKEIRVFRETLSSLGIKATVRKERGREIRAACGQLRKSSLKA